MVLPQLIKKLEYKLCSTRNIRVPKFLWLVDFQIQNFFHFNKGTAWHDSTLNKTMANSSLNSVKRIVYYDEKKNVSTEIVIEEVLDAAYGCYIWPSALVMGEFVWHDRDRFAGATVLEVFLIANDGQKSVYRKKKKYRLEQVLRYPHSF